MVICSQQVTKSYYNMNDTVLYSITCNYLVNAIKDMLRICCNICTISKIKEICFCFYHREITRRNFMLYLTIYLKYYIFT